MVLARTQSYTFTRNWAEHKDGFGRGQQNGVPHTEESSTNMIRNTHMARPRPTRLA